MKLKHTTQGTLFLDDKGRVIDTAPAWWPSSVTGDNRIKGWLNENLYSDTYQLDKSLMHIASVQKALEHNNIEYYMFLGYDMPLDNADKHGIDLSKFVTLEPLYDDYHSSDWQKIFYNKRIWSCSCSRMGIGSFT